MSTDFIPITDDDRAKLGNVVRAIDHTLSALGLELDKFERAKAEHHRTVAELRQQLANLRGDHASFTHVLSQYYLTDEGKWDFDPKRGGFVRLEEQNNTGVTNANQSS